MDKIKKNIKICMFGQKNLSRAGGVEVVVTELATRMVTRGCEVTCINRKGTQNGIVENTSLINSQGVKIKYAPTINKKGLAAMTSSICASFMAALGDYDVVHIHAEGPAFMCWIPKVFGKKIVVTIHGLDHQRAKWGGFASSYIMMGEKNAVRFADDIIVLSKGVQEYFAEKYGRETKYIPNGVNGAHKRKAELITSKWGLKKDDYILYLGRIVPEKGAHYLIEAFKQIKTDKKLVIAGGSSDTDDFYMKLEQLAKTDDRIIFTGFVQGKLLEELYSNAYIYTLPSDLEGMPLSLLEGMSYGNCCLTSDISECADVVEDKAVLFEKGNIEHLRSTLQELCDDAERVKKYKNEAEEFILNKYSWDDVVDKTIKLYRSEGENK